MNNNFYKFCKIDFAMILIGAYLFFNFINSEFKYLLVTFIILSIVLFVMDYKNRGLNENTRN